MKREVYEFISKQMNDPILERRTCPRTGEEFAIFDSERKLLDKLSPIIGGKKYQLSLPTLSPKARQIKRMARRNERKFYKFTNEKGQAELTTIAPEMGLKTVTQQAFYDHDNMQCGVEYSGDFVADFKRILKSLPYPNKLTHNMENAEYCNQETDDKNCYLNAGGHFNENSMYTTYSLYGIWTIDNYWVFHSQHIYQSIKVEKSQKVFFSQQIEDSYNIYFSHDLKGCQNVLFGFGLVNASYVYKNKILSKEEREKIYQIYKERIATNVGLQEIQKEADEFHAQFPKKAINNLNCERVSGDDLKNIKDALICTAGEDTQNVMHSNLFAFASDCMDVESFARGQKVYNFSSSMQATNCIVGSQIFENVQDSEYIYFSKNSSFLFGCMGLNHKKYCIFNKQYEEKEWEKLTQKVIEELQSKGKFGEFFEPENSPFPYNDSVAYDYYPVDLKQLQILNPEKFISDAILDLGGEEKIRIKRRTRESEINIPKGLIAIKAQELPENIAEIQDDILKKVVICEISGRPFRIMPMELEFYRKHGISLPHKHPDIRHAERFSKRPGRELHLRKCDKCSIEMLSVYPTTSAYKVYCEACYNKEIYG